MKNIFYYSLLFTLSLTIFSCTKSGQTLRGRVLENITNTPLQGVEVEIYAGKSTGLFEPPITWLEGTATTNTDGKFSIEVDDADYYQVGKFYKENYFEDLSAHDNKSQNQSIAQSGARANPDFFIDPMGTLHVIVENDPGVPGDFIRATIPGHVGPLTTFSSVNEYNVVKANRHLKYNYKIDENEIYNDSIFINPFDTTELKIIF